MYDPYHFVASVGDLYPTVFVVAAAVVAGSPYSIEQGSVLHLQNSD